MTESVTPDPRPLVAKPDNRWTLLVGAALLVLLAIGLFISLEAARSGEDEAQVDARARPILDLGSSRSIPALELPPQEVVSARQGLPLSEPANVEAPRPTIVRVEPEVRYLPSPDPYIAPAYPSYDDYTAPSPSPRTRDDLPTMEAPSAERIVAGRIAAPQYTVVQGTLINAVLETALDSTRPGQARALVTKDVMAFDGERVLIPRGSRIFGTYKAEVEPGQKRVLIEWVRLLTPEGVSVALNSPSADPLGRAGLKGKVDNHTLRRIGDALLGSVVELGGIVAGREVGHGATVVLPGATQTTNGSGSRIQPTITVEQGTRVTVFVATDLDFSLVATS